MSDQPPIPRTLALDWSCANKDTKETKDAMLANLNSHIKLEIELNAALAENERLREGLKEWIDVCDHAPPMQLLARFSAEVDMTRKILAIDPIPAARQLLAASADAVAGMQNELQAKTL